MSRRYSDLVTEKEVCVKKVGYRKTMNPSSSGYMSASKEKLTHSLQNLPLPRPNAINISPYLLVGVLS